MSTATNEMNLAEAEAVVDQIFAYVGWDNWRPERGRITLDGSFTVAEIEALAIVLRDRVSEVPIKAAPDA